MADFDRKIFVLGYILRMLLFAVLITTVTSAGERLPDVRLRTLAIPPYCQSLNHCKEHEEDRDKLIDFCFSHYCKDNNESVHCIEHEVDEKTKAIYFCSAPRYCDAGLTDKAVYDASNNQVLLTNTECPEPYFQPHPDFCNKTCRYKHRQTPPHVIILFPGNSSQSAIGVCNSSEGYVFESGPDAPSVFSIDEYRDPCICRWDLESIGCSKEEDVCPNGTCVARCPAHRIRDLCDCLCKPENETLTCQDNILDAWISREPNISTTTNSVSNYITASSTSVPTETSDTGLQGIHIFLIVMISVLVLVAILILVLLTVGHKLRTGSSNGRPPQRITYNQNQTNVERAEVVLINPSSERQSGEALLENIVSDHQEEESSL